MTRPWPGRLRRWCAASSANWEFPCAMPESSHTASGTETVQAAPGELRGHVLYLALPALGEQLLNFCVSLFDTWLAGQVSTGSHETGIYTTTVGIASYIGWLA